MRRRQFIFKTKTCLGKKFIQVYILRVKSQIIFFIYKKNKIYTSNP